MFRRTAAVVVGCVVILAVSLAFAELSGGKKMAVEALIKQFSAPEFAKRQEAVDRLVELGPDVAPLVRDTFNETSDAEVRLRCEMVLKKLAEKYPDAMGEGAPAAGGTAAAGKPGYDASRVTIHVKNADLETVLQALADQSGNPRVAMPKDWEDRPITFDAEKLTYWQALDKLCAELKLIAVLDLQSREFQLMPLGEAADMAAYAGPAVVKFDSLTATRRFRAIPNVMMGGEDGLRLMMVYFLEPRLSPLEIEAEVTKVVGSDGRALTAEQVPEAARGFWGNRGFRGLPNTPFSGYIIALRPAPARAAERLSRVEGVVRATYGAGKKEAKIDDVLNGEEKTVTVGNITLSVAQSQRMGGRGGRGGNDRGGALSLTVTCEIDGREQPLPPLSRESGYGFVLVDPNGEKHPSVGAYAGGLFRGGPGGQPEAEENLRRNRTNVFFNDVPEVDGAWALLITLPEKLIVKEHPFTFTDVPLR